MTFYLTVDMDNAAFEEYDAGREVARILRKVAQSVDGFHYDEMAPDEPQPLRDINGNRVGEWKVTR